MALKKSADFTSDQWRSPAFMRLFAIFLGRFERRSFMRLKCDV